MNTQQPQPTIGERAYLYRSKHPDDRVLLFEDAYDYDVFVKAVATGDRTRAKAAWAMGFHVDANTPALILGSLAGRREVRVLEGPEANRRGFVAKEAVQASPLDS